MPFAHDLYVDDVRLRRLIERFRSPITYDKVSVLKTTVSLPPSGEATQERPQRSLTREEQIEALEKWLREKKELGSGRVRTLAEEAPAFRTETLVATKVVLRPRSVRSMVEESDLDAAADEFGFGPSQRLDVLEHLRARESARVRARKILEEQVRTELEGFEGIAFWISSDGGPDGSARLILIAGFPDEAEEHTWPVVSAYSALYSLVRNASALFRKTVLAESVDEISRPAADLHARFLAEPVETLRRLGAQAYGERRIAALYQIREALIVGPVAGGGGITTVGYPIYVRSA